MTRNHHKQLSYPPPKSRNISSTAATTSFPFGDIRSDILRSTQLTGHEREFRPLKRKVGRRGFSDERRGFFHGERRFSKHHLAQGSIRYGRAFSDLDVVSKKRSMIYTVDIMNRTRSDGVLAQNSGFQSGDQISKTTSRVSYFQYLQHLLHSSSLLVVSPPRSSNVASLA